MGEILWLPMRKTEGGSVHGVCLDFDFCLSHSTPVLASTLWSSLGDGGRVGSVP